jgi:hypothetical protein
MSTILERLDRLPKRNLTVLALKGVSTLVPGGWRNITSADDLIADVVGSSDPELIASVRSRADVLSRAGKAEIERQLQAFGAERVDARLITLSRLDYGLDLSTLAGQLVQRWSADPPAGSSPDPLLLLLIDTQTRSTAIAAQAPLDRQLPDELLESTAATTIHEPSRSRANCFENGRKHDRLAVDLT